MPRAAWQPHVLHRCCARRASRCVAAVRAVLCCAPQDPHMRPNFVAVVDALKEIEGAGSVGRLDAQYWSRGNAFI